MPHVVTQSCCADASCVVACPVNCIHPAPGEPGFAEAEMLYVDPAGCVDCGACEPACPVEAIFYEDDVPDEWLDYNDANAAFFDDLGSPGGAAALGPQDFDVPMIAALPPQNQE